jgi:phage FluMu protein Com
MPTEALEIKCHSCKELNIIVEGENIDEYITSKHGEKHCDT